VPLTFEEEVALYGEPKTPVSYKVLNTSYQPASASTALSSLSCEHEAVLLKTFDGDTFVIADRIPNFIISNIVYTDLPPAYDRAPGTPAANAVPRKHDVVGNVLNDNDSAYTWNKSQIISCGFDDNGDAIVHTVPRTELGGKLIRQKGWFLVVGYDTWKENVGLLNEQTYYQANTILLNQDGEIVEYDFDNPEDFRLKISTYKEARNKLNNTNWTTIYTPQTSIHQEQWLDHLNVHAIAYDGSFYVSDPESQIDDPTQIVYRELNVGSVSAGKGSNNISLSTTVLNKEFDWLSDSENTLLDYGGYIQYLTVPEDSYLSYYNGNGLFTYSPIGSAREVFYTADFSRTATLSGDYDIGGMTLSSIVTAASYENINQCIVLPQTCLNLNSYLYQPYVSLYGKGIYVVAGMERYIEKDESLTNPVTLHKGPSCAFSKMEMNGYIATSTSKRRKDPRDFRISIIEHKPDKLVLKTSPAIFKNSNIILTMQVSPVEMTLVNPTSGETAGQYFSSINIFAMSAYGKKSEEQIISGQSYYIGEENANLFLFENVGFSNLDITIHSEKYDSEASIKIKGFDSLWNLFYIEQTAAVPSGVELNPYSNFIYLVSGDQQFLNLPLHAKAAYYDSLNDNIYLYNASPSAAMVWEWWWTDGPFQTVDLNISNIQATSLTNSQPYSAGEVELMDDISDLNLSIAPPRKRSDFYSYDAPGLLKVRVSAPDYGVTDEFLFEIESPHYFYSRKPVYFINGTTPTTLDKNGTGLWNTVMYTSGVANTPSQNAIVLHLTGFGNGVVGSSGTFYFDGYPSTTINGYYQTGYYELGTRVKTPTAFPLNIHKATADNNLWYVYGQNTPYSTVSVTLVLEHFSPELNYSVSKISNSWVKTPSANDVTVTIVPSGIYYSVQTTISNIISSSNYYLINNFGVAEFMLNGKITNLDLVAGVKTLSASHAYQFGTGQTLSSISAINFVDDGVSFIRDIKTMEFNYYMVSSGLASVVSGVRIDIPGYTDYYYRWEALALPYKIESSGYYQLIPYDNKWCFLTVFDDTETLVNTVSAVTGIKSIVQIANAYYDYGSSGSSNPTLPPDGTIVVDENGPMGAGTYTISYTDPPNPTFETQTYTFVEGLPG